jgi:hypothetical protein
MPTIFESVRSLLFNRLSTPQVFVPPPLVADGFDLPLRFEPNLDAREAASLDRVTRGHGIAESLLLPGAGYGDTDDWQYRRVTDGKRITKRNLTPMQHDQMLRVSNYLWEQNPLARRLIELMTDLILGEGTTVQADDERVGEILRMTWDEDMDVFSMAMAEHHNSLSCCGDLFIPCTINPITGRPTFGFFDAYDIKRIHFADNNPLLPDVIELRPDDYASVGQKFKVIRRNPATRMLEGDCFLSRINGLPNSERGRSDLTAVADWVDLYDQYLYAQVERLQLLSAFAWDVTIKSNDPEYINKRAREFPQPRPGMLYVHNEAETMEAVTPQLHGSDHSETARALRTHIGGSRGFPASYLGDMDSNKATIEGQNDVMMKTPARRQKHFALTVKQMVTFTIQSTTQRNPALYRDINTKYKVVMPEIAAKDIARASASLASVATAGDTAVNSGLISRRVARLMILGIAQHLGVNADMELMEKEIEQEQEERDQKAMELQNSMARAAKNNPNPPAAPDDDDDVRVVKRQRPGAQG